MENYNKKKGFTIAELVIALMLIAFIAMILMPIVFNDSKKQVLMASLNKNYTALQDIHHAIPMLQARGKISPGGITATTFMQAVALTQNAIGLKDGKVVNDAINKYPQYIAGYITTPADLLNTYTQFSLDAGNINNTTIILKNGVFISKYNVDTIMIDINGKRNPNKTGEDIFFFSIIDGTTSGVANNISWSNSSSTLQPVDSPNCTVGGDFTNSAGCAKKYIEAGKMD